MVLAAREEKAGRRAWRAGSIEWQCDKRGDHAGNRPAPDCTSQQAKFRPFWAAD
jgi:hypothetical protein